jgi:hypothetical protein
MEQQLVSIFREGNQVCALYGASLMEGTAGFGDNTADALRDLAKQLEEEGIVEEIDSSL